MFGMGTLKPQRADGSVWEYRVSNFETMCTKIIPFFERHPLYTYNKKCISFDKARITPYSRWTGKDSKDAGKNEQDPFYSINPLANLHIASNIRTKSLDESVTNLKIGNKIGQKISRGNIG
jgi:hypothetical protein